MGRTMMLHQQPDGTGREICTLDLLIIRLKSTYGVRTCLRGVPRTHATYGTRLLRPQVHAQAGRLPILYATHSCVRAGCWLRATTARGCTGCSRSYGTVWLGGQSQSYARVAGARGQLGTVHASSASSPGRERPSWPWRGAGARPRAAALRPSVIGAGTWCPMWRFARPSVVLVRATVPQLQTGQNRFGSKVMFLWSYSPDFSFSFCGTAVLTLKTKHI